MVPFAHTSVVHRICLIDCVLWHVHLMRWCLVCGMGVGATEEDLADLKQQKQVHRLRAREAQQLMRALLSGIAEVAVRAPDDLCTYVLHVKSSGLAWTVNVVWFGLICDCHVVWSCSGQ